MYNLNLLLEKTSIKKAIHITLLGKASIPLKGSKKLIYKDAFIEPFDKSDKTANNVKKVRSATKNFEILSRALYLPRINIIPETMRITIDKSIAGNAEKKGILVNRTPVTKLTAAMVKVPVIKLTIRNKGR